MQPIYFGTPRPSSKLWRFAHWFGPYAPLIVMFISGLVLLSLTRLGLVIWKWERVQATGELCQILLQGVRVDVIQLGLLALIPVLVSPVLATRGLFKVWRRFTFWWVLLSLVLLVFLEAATPGFILEYDVRPNRIFVEYLKYPHEVFGMLWQGFKVELFFGLAMSLVAVALVARLLKPWRQAEPKWNNLVVWLVWPLLLVLTIFGIRSSLGHRPANPALFAITQDSMVNSLILNSSYSVFYAAYSLQHEAKSSAIYGKLPREKIFALTGAQDTDIPTLTTLTPSVKRDKPLNLVILLQESLGAGFVESLGGKPVTPNLEKLKAEGIWFTHLYATGTRSVRGIEAVVTGFQPTPSDSTVKLDLSQKNFFTLASLLSKRGYLTEFIYGGESHFDNMRSFFMGNGFQQITDQPDFINPVFVASWGASDEDLLNKTHEQLMAHHASGKPFFTLAFSSSNHAPFEFPDGRIKLYEQPKATDNNAVKYADYAIGEFFKKAKASPYWNDTVFLIVADHDIRVRGDSLVPIEHFHIPALILGGAVQPKTVEAIASQIDLPVTVLSLMGIDAKHPMTGHDLSNVSADYHGRAMMQYNYNFGWMQQTGPTVADNEVVVLREGKAPAFGHYNPLSKQLQNTAPPADAAALAERALANSLLPALLYQEQRYRLPE
ncbi:LTA synthase family protein [Methylophilus sp. YYY-1]|uniref:LTA synthase family protein n=1 Tax=Methylophilus sp. YYY-1 TaxID=2682087 RepID=UPI0023B257AE|nr:LTA synthase family protein [Methylophilus sp. YYY-1]MDF0378952.1 sulfatase-like hydrolase/transferase [Methylophilus sp. YYY-1]